MTKLPTSIAGVAALAMTLAITACGADAVVPVSPGTYSVSASSRTRALQAASDHCKAQGKQVDVKDVGNSISSAAIVSTDVTFQCV